MGSTLPTVIPPGTLPNFGFVAPVPAGADFPFPEVYRSLGLQERADWTLYVVGPDIDEAQFRSDPRVTVLRSEATLASALDAALAVTTCPYLAVLTQDGKVLETALAHFTQTMGADLPDVLYSDEAIGAQGQSRVLLKPDFSPERLRCQFYLGNCTFYRTDLIRQLGGLDASRPGAELYEFALRVARTKPSVLHVRESLFMQPAGAPRTGSVTGDLALESTRLALADHLEKTGGGFVESVHESGIHRTHRSVVGDPLVSIIIPTRAGVGTVHGRERCLVIDCVRSIVEKSTYQHYEIVIVIDSVADASVVESLQEIAGDRLRLVWWDLPFNFSAKMNRGVFASRGEFVLFLNDDTEVITPGWIEPMLSLAQLPRAGMSGAMLYFEDDSIQHAGHIYEAGDAGHIGTNDMRHAVGPSGSYLVEREVSGVTAACSMMPRAVFDEVGGFSILLPGNFNDVDLCMKVGQLGYAIYWTPNSELYHYESKSRVSRVTRYEVETAWGRWEWRMDDPTYWPYGALASPNGD